MLQTKTVEPNTFSILKQLIGMPELKDFSLVGGTALSLLFGHRQSVDLDLFSTEDIIAMKVQAILGRGRKKDFWDVAELLKYFSVADFIKFHKEKYASQNLLITVPQALTYFADAEESEDPIGMKNQTWKSIQKFIKEKVGTYLS